MPRKIYCPESIESLSHFYHKLNNIVGNSNSENSLLNEIIQHPVLKQYDKIEKQLGTWAMRMDPNAIGTDAIEHQKISPTLYKALYPATYKGICESLVAFTKQGKLNAGMITGWINKFADPESEFYCKQFNQDIGKINPNLVVFRDEQKEKRWLAIYVRETKLIPLYLNKKSIPKAVSIANKEVGSMRSKRSVYSLARDYLVFDSNYFDSRLLQLTLAYCGYKTQPTHEGIKQTIIEQLAQERWIDSPGEHLNTSKTNESLWYWFDLYTNESSDFYDHKFTKKLKEDHPRQFSIMSLKYGSESFRFNDKKKDEWIKILKEQGKNGNYVGMGALVGGDSTFAKIVEEIKATWGTTSIERTEQRKQLILEAVKQGKNVFEEHLDDIEGIEKNKEKMSGYVRRFCFPGKCHDKQFTDKINELDPNITEVIKSEKLRVKEWSRKRASKKYQQIKENKIDSQWCAISPSFETMPFLDYENSIREPGYKNSFDPSLYAEIRKENPPTRDTVRRVWREKYNEPCPNFQRAGTWAGFVKNGKSIPYTWNLPQISNFFVAKTIDNLIDDIGDLNRSVVVSGIKKHNYYVPRKGKFMGWVFFKSDQKLDKQSAVDFINKLKDGTNG